MTTRAGKAVSRSGSAKGTRSEAYRGPRTDRFRVGIVSQALSGGGVSSVVKFLHSQIQASPDFEAVVVTLATSSRDPDSVRLTRPRSWLTGPQRTERQWEGVRHVQLGAWFAELEFQRFQPRRALDELLADVDIVQVVAGTPAVCLAASHFQVPVFLQVATFAAEERAKRLSSGRGIVNAWRRVMTWITSRADTAGLNRADLVFVENDHMLDAVQQIIGTDRTVLAPPGIDTRLFSPGGPGTSPFPGCILSVGRFDDPRKDIATLVRAYAEVRGNLTGTPPLVLAGRVGPGREVLQLAERLGVGDSIHVIEDVPPGQLVQLYREATVFTLASAEEGLGIVMIEAMSCGTPVVSTDTAGARAVIDHGVTGFIVKVGDPTSLAEGVTRILKNPALRDELGRHARDAAVLRYSADRTGATFLQAYRQALGDSQDKSIRVPGAEQSGFS